jgi:hypothetical protein
LIDALRFAFELAARGLQARVVEDAGRKQQPGRRRGPGRDLTGGLTILRSRGVFGFRCTRKRKERRRDFSGGGQSESDRRGG